MMLQNISWKINLFDMNSLESLLPLDLFLPILYYVYVTVFVYLYIYICVCVCVCMCVCVCVCARTRLVCVCVCVCLWSYIYTHIYIYIYIYIYICGLVCNSVYMCGCVYVLVGRKCLHWYNIFSTFYFPSCFLRLFERISCSVPWIIGNILSHLNLCHHERNIYIFLQELYSRFILLSM